MRAKNEYKFLAEAYSQVNEGFEDPDKSEEPETHKPYVSSYIPFHRDEDDKLKPSKKIWAVLDQDGNAIFTSNNKDEAYKWFADNFKRLREYGGPEFDPISAERWGDEGDPLEDPEFNKLENERERARDRGREAKDKGDWDEWNKQENEREDAKDALREIEDPEDYWTPKGLEVGRRVTYETSKGNQSTGKVLEIGQDVVKIRDELAGEEKEILIKDILKVESELGKGPELPPRHPLR